MGGGGGGGGGAGGGGGSAGHLLVSLVPMLEQRIAKHTL